MNSPKFTFLGLLLGWKKYRVLEKWYIRRVLKISEKKMLSGNLKLQSLTECHGIDRLHILQWILEDQKVMNFIKRS